MYIHSLSRSWPAEIALFPSDRPWVKRGTGAVIRHDIWNLRMVSSRLCEAMLRKRSAAARPRASNRSVEIR